LGAQALARDRLTPTGQARGGIGNAEILENPRSIQHEFWRRCSALSRHCHAQGEPGHCNRHLAGAGTRRWFSMRRPTTPGCLKPTRTAFALDATHHPHITMLQAVRSHRGTSARSTTAANPDSGQRESDKLEPEGVQVLLHPSPAKRHCGALSVEADGEIYSGCNRRYWMRLRLSQRGPETAAAFVSGRRRSRHPTRIDRVRGQFHYGSASGKESSIRMSQSVVAPEAYLNEMARGNPSRRFTFSPGGRVSLPTRQFLARLARSSRRLSLTP